MNFDNRSIDPAAQQMLAVARDLGAQTTWDRFDAMQPHCGFGELGVCCDICYMGPCRIDPFGERAQVGACGANAHLIVARNFVRAVAAGAAEHSDHGREVVEALASGLAVANPEKLNVLAAEYGVAPGDVTAKMASQFGLQNGPLALLRVAMRAALADGWGGSMIATDVQDALFGGPQAIRSRANLGVLEEKQVNLLVHGHEPVLSEMIVAASRDQDLLALARQAGAEGINVAGICLHGE